MPESDAPTRDRSFAATVLLGVAAGVLAAVAATREWASASGDAAGIKVEAAVTGSETAPLASALALVALAAWGVLLVLRGRMRRAVAVVGALAAAGVVAVVVERFDGAQDDALTAVQDKGATGDAFSSSLTSWYYTAGIAAALVVLAFVVAVLRSPRWPAMGSRYDAPSARDRTPAAEDDMWRALDEGRDPTS